MRSSVRLIVLAIACIPVLPVASAAPQAERQPASAPLTVEYQPIAVFDRREPERRRFGTLEFRGGLVLRSSHPAFGGISGLSVDDAGASFVAVTDWGHWLRGRIMAEGDRPIGLAETEIAAIVVGSQPTKRAQRLDSEALAADGGVYYVAFERLNAVYRFDLAKFGLSARGRPVAMPAGVRSLPRSYGLEALALAPKRHPLAGALITVAERDLDSSGRIPGFIVGGRKPGTFAVKRRDDFDVTDAAFLPEGDLILLERHFSFVRGVEMRIRRIRAAAIEDGAVVDGAILIEAKPGQEIDNMEAIAVHRNANGETILTLLSDDNFQRWQRTILLRFAIADR